MIIIMMIRSSKNHNNHNNNNNHDNRDSGSTVVGVRYFSSSTSMRKKSSKAARAFLPCISVRSTSKTVVINTSFQLSTSASTLLRPHTTTTCLPNPTYSVPGHSSNNSNPSSLAFSSPYLAFFYLYPPHIL